MENDKWSKSPGENQLLSHLKAVLETPMASEYAKNTFFHGEKASVGFHETIENIKKQGRLAMNGSLKAERRKEKKKLNFIEW